MEDYNTGNQDGFGGIDDKEQYEYPRDMAQEVIESFVSREIEAMEISEDGITVFGGPIE